MGFKDVRGRLIDCLKEANYEHESREDIQTKNLLASGAISAEDLIDIVLFCKGGDYETSEHHFLRNIQVHIFKPTVSKQRWYIKCYFIEPKLMIISVHR